ncbi:MAG: hypothetical protein ACJAYU_001868 [Bradymonadia bacterium]|jgi:hypothetical protein
MLLKAIDDLVVPSGRCELVPVFWDLSLGVVLVGINPIFTCGQAVEFCSELGLYFLRIHASLPVG